jgi:hypothetical protein
LQEAEKRGLPCLFKLRHTEKVKTLVSQMQHAGAAWEDTGQGWEVLETTLRLSGLCARSLFPETGNTIITEEVRKIPTRK